MGTHVAVSCCTWSGQHKPAIIQAQVSKILEESDRDKCQSFIQDQDEQTKPIPWLIWAWPNRSNLCL